MPFDLSPLPRFRLLPRCIDVVRVGQDPHAPHPRNAGTPIPSHPLPSPSFIHFCFSSHLLSVFSGCRHIASARQGVLLGGQSEEDHEALQLRRRTACGHVWIRCPLPSRSRRDWELLIDLSVSRSVQVFLLFIISFIGIK